METKKKNWVGMCGAVSQAELGGVSCLTDENTETYWESDGMQGQHWIRLHMKRGTVVKWASEQFARWQSEVEAIGSNGTY